MGFGLFGVVVHYNMTVVKSTGSRLTLSQTTDQNYCIKKPLMGHNSERNQQPMVTNPVTNVHYDSKLSASLVRFLATLLASIKMVVSKVIV